MAKTDTVPETVEDKPLLETAYGLMGTPNITMTARALYNLKANPTNSRLLKGIQFGFKGNAQKLKAGVKTFTDEFNDNLKDILNFNKSRSYLDNTLDQFSEGNTLEYRSGYRQGPNEYTWDGIPNNPDLEPLSSDNAIELVSVENWSSMGGNMAEETTPITTRMMNTMTSLAKQGGDKVNQVASNLNRRAGNFLGKQMFGYEQSETNVSNSFMGEGMRNKYYRSSMDESSRLLNNMEPSIPEQPFYTDNKPYTPIIRYYRSIWFIISIKSLFISLLSDNNESPWLLLSPLFTRP